MADLRLESAPLAQYRQWAQAPTGLPVLDRLLGPALEPQIGIGAAPVGMVGDAPGPLAALLAKAGRVFHGTGEVFDEFAAGKTRHPGFWFSDSPKEAGLYATGAAPNMRMAGLQVTNPAPPALYARVLGALQQDAQRAGQSLSSAQLHAAVGKKLAEHGFDSVAGPGMFGATQFGVFDPAKIGLPRLTGGQ